MYLILFLVLILSLFTFLIELKSKALVVYFLRKYKINHLQIWVTFDVFVVMIVFGNSALFYKKWIKYKNKCDIKDLYFKHYL